MRRLVLALLAMFCVLGVASQALAYTKPYSQVVDNSMKNRFTAEKAWSTSSYSANRYGKDYSFVRPTKAGGAARFKTKIPRTGRYTIYARWPSNSGYNASTPIGVRSISGMKWNRVDQRKNGGRWVRLGTYRMEGGDRYNVAVSRRGKGSNYVIADAVKVVMASPVISTRSAARRDPDSMLGAPIYSQAEAQRYARSVGSTRYILQAIPYYYKLAPRTGIAPDVLVAQAMLETGRGHYGGDSKPWNMAGVKKGGAVGDAPRDFERPATAYEGVRMHINHMAAYTGKKTIGKPHARYYDARAAQRNRGWWVKRISQLGNGVWATDPAYAGKLRRMLDDMGKR